MMRAARRSPVLAAVLLVLSLAACGGGPWNDPYPGAPSGRPILYQSFNERPKHLDPARSYSANEYRFIAQIYEPPLQYHYLKRPYTLIPLTAQALPQVRRPDAARSVPSSGPPGAGTPVEYVIHIRPGIRYQPHPAFARGPDGRFLYHDLGPQRLESIHTLSRFARTGTRELVAGDYVYQIKRLADPALVSPIAGLMSEHIVGFREFGERLKALREAAGPQGDGRWLDLREVDMAGVEAIGRHAFRIRLKGRYPQFRYWLAMPFFAPVPWEADRFYAQPGMAQRNLTLDWYPVGTGPYMLSENDPNRRMVLSRNPNFHRELYPSGGDTDDGSLLHDAGRPLPFIGQAIFTLEKEDIPYWNKFLQGYYDLSGIVSDNFDQAVRLSGQGDATLTDDMLRRGIRLATEVNTSIMYMGFNMLDPVVGGDTERARLLRRAISIAVDYEEYISIFANGRGVAAQGPIPPGIFGHLEGREGLNPCVYEWSGRGYVRKPLEAARRLMAEAGYADGIDAGTGKPLILYYDTVGAGPDARARLSWIRKQFARLGIQLVIRATDYNRFQDKMRHGTAQIYQWGWNADYPDPENFLFLLYGPNGKVESGGENASNYRNERYDRLFTTMKDLPDGPARQAVIGRMVDILRRDAPWLFGYFPRTFTLYHGWLGNLEPNLMANNTLKYLRVDPAAREDYRRRWNRPLLWPLWALGAVLAALVLPAVMAYRRRQQATAL